MAEGSSVTIEGSGTDDVLRVTGGTDGAAIGGYSDSGDKPCGNIVIKNVTLHAYAIDNYILARAPGIGTTGGTCGRIEISSAIVYAVALEMTVGVPLPSAHTKVCRKSSSPIRKSMPTAVQTTAPAMPITSVEEEA